MNYRQVIKQMGVVAFLIGATMVFSLPWAIPGWGHRYDLPTPDEFEQRGFLALCASMLICCAVGAVCYAIGRSAKGRLYRKEAMAIVGLSWVLATILGALPYLLAGVRRSAEEPMNVADALFESQSGFSTTGATVISELENIDVIPHCILFWRSSTHFLGGLGIIVLFVVVLGQGSAGKALMRAEMPGPTQESSAARMQHTAWLFTGTYTVLNLLLAIILKLEGLSWFDAFCHAFGTMATGGFSTYDTSLGHFDSPLIEYTVIVFMLLAGTNFTLLILAIIGNPMQLLRDVEFRVYIGLIAVITMLVILFCFSSFPGTGFAERLANALRYGLFQVVSIITTTGYGTHDFDLWNNFGRAALFALMFVGGCAGSTGGGMKVIRHVLFYKVLALELEKSYHPTVVRPLRLAGKPVEDPDLHKNILVYFAMILAIFILSWILVVSLEPDSTWGDNGLEHKLIDSASGVAATLNNIGPGLGTVGATQNYGHFSWWNKLLFVFLMMVGRLEVFAIMVLISPRFWRRR